MVPCLELGEKAHWGRKNVGEFSSSLNLRVRPFCCGGTSVNQSSLQEPDGALLFLQQEVVLTCSSGQWDRSVTCDPVDCRVPDQSHVSYAEFSCPVGTTYMQRCSFSCIPPAKLQGMVWSVKTFNHPFRCHLAMPAPSSSNRALLLGISRLSWICQLGGLLRHFPK